MAAFYPLFVAALFVGISCAREGAVRVSWKECNIEPGLKEDCGFYGIREEQCYERECCFSESATMGTPWCYYSKPTLSKKCTVSDEERNECGSYGIRKEQCLAHGCCWQPTSGNSPWCYQTRTIPIQSGECGNPAIPPKVRSSTRIVGGVEAVPHSWPWQVSLQLDGFHFCGATIVNKYWVVSAAHCGSAFMWGTVNVVVGAHALDASQNSSDVQRIEVVDKFLHDEYDYDTGSNELSDDIMLLQLESPITFQDEISPACIPDQDVDVEAGTRCYATGWGTLELMGDSPNELQQVSVPILEQETCIEWYSDPQNWYNGGDAPPVTDKMICAGFEEGGRGTCHGDSGGPMVCNLDGKWTLTGVVSWGGPCAHERTPSVFARVSRYNTWMQQIISDNDASKRKR